MAKSVLLQLRNAVKKDGRPQRQIAKAAGISPSALSRFVRGSRGLLMPAIDRLSLCLGLELLAKDEPHGR